MSAYTGKLIRLNRLFDEYGISILYGGCHHMTTRVSIPGQVDVVKACDKVIKGGATGIIIGKGFNQRVVPVLKRGVSILNYVPVYPAYSKVNPYAMIATTTVEEAAINGADGLVLPVDFYSEDAEKAMRAVAEYVRECDKYGLVFVVEAEYPTFYESNDDNVEKYGADYLKFSGRICSELGVDIISTNYTNSPNTFAEIIDFVKLPVLINGGTKVNEKGFLDMIEIVAKAGAKGCLIGRNISESSNPTRMTRAIGDIFRHGLSSAEAYQKMMDKQD